MVTIHVVEPPEAERAAQRAFQGNASGRFVAGFGDDEDVVRQFEALVRDMPRTVYAPYARLALAKYYLRRGRFDDSAAALEKLLESAAEFPLRADVEYLIAKANHDHAIQRFEAIVKANPNWTWSHRARRLLETNSKP